MAADTDRLEEIKRDLQDDSLPWRGDVQWLLKRISILTADRDTWRELSQQYSTVIMELKAAQEVLQAEHQRLDSALLEEDLERNRLVEETERLKTALAGLIGVSGREELEQMEAVIRLTPAPAEDKAAMIDAIHALLRVEAPSS